MMIYDEPLLFLASDKLFAVDCALDQLQGVQIISDYKLAQQLCQDQHVPSGFKVWQDYLSQQVVPFRVSAEYDNADAALAETLAAVSVFQRQLSLSYRKKRIKKLNTALDDFIDSEIGEAYELLRLSSVYRYIYGIQEDSFFERVFEVFKTGLYPCGITDQQVIVAFNPVSL